MKTINKFLLEKLIINKNSKAKTHTKYPSELVKLPVCDFGDSIVLKNQTWKELVLPNTNYVIYNDMYRGAHPHFNTTDDFVCSICAFEDDYEDFDPAKDILYASDDLKEILKWYFEYLGIYRMPNEDNYEDWVDEYEHDFKGCIDDGKVLAEIYCGIDTYYNKPKFTNIDYKKDLDEILKTYFDI